jgi:hypothetical protein
VLKSDLPLEPQGIFNHAAIVKKDIGRLLLNLALQHGEIVMCISIWVAPEAVKAEIIKIASWFRPFSSFPARHLTGIEYETTSNPERFLVSITERMQFHLTELATALT